MTEHSEKLQAITAQLDETQSRFLRLLEAVPESEWDRAPAGGGWTAKQEMVHIVQALEVLPAGIERAKAGAKRSLLGSIPTGTRNWVNGRILIPLKARNQTRDTIARAYQGAHQALLRNLEGLAPDDWEKGLPYPRQYRTIEQLARRPIGHFEEHVGRLPLKEYAKSEIRI